jgi:splicing suppressor protein 51
MPEKCKNRERIAASAGSGDVPFIPVGAIRGNLCFRCFDPSTNILKCSACKRAGYCSKQCQKLDWSIAHKNHCKIFKTINEVEEQQYQRTRSWAEYRKYLVSETSMLCEIKNNIDVLQLTTVRVIRNAAPNDEVLRFVVQSANHISYLSKACIKS